MFNMARKADAKNPHRHNSGGTLSWQDRVEGNNRMKKFRASLFSTKNNPASTLYEMVMMPEDIDEEESLDFSDPKDREIEMQNEWVAENLVDFYQELNMLYNIFLHGNDAWQDALRNPENMVNKGYPPNVKYLWKYSLQSVPVELRVDDYIFKTLEWLESQVLNEDIFPTDGEVMLRMDFIPKFAKKMFSRMNRIFAILLVNEELSGVGNERPNEQTKAFISLHKRFTAFCFHWKLIPEQETYCIKEFVKPIKSKYKAAEKDFFVKHPHLRDI